MFCQQFPVTTNISSGLCMAQWLWAGRSQLNPTVCLGEHCPAGSLGNCFQQSPWKPWSDPLCSVLQHPRLDAGSVHCFPTALPSTGTQQRHNTNEFGKWGLFRPLESNVSQMSGGRKAGPVQRPQVSPQTKQLLLITVGPHEFLKSLAIP